jgi:hypothetical protein
MSERNEVANRIAAKISEWNLCEVYGGDVKQDTERKGKPYIVGFSTRRFVDGEVSVFSPNFIHVKYETGIRELPHRDNIVFGSENKALDFIRLAFVESKFEEALKVQRKK